MTLYINPYDDYYETESYQQHLAEHKAEMERILRHYYESGSEQQARSTAANLSVLEYQLERIIDIMHQSKKTSDIAHYVGIAPTKEDQQILDQYPMNILEHVRQLHNAFEGIHKVIQHDNQVMEALAKEAPETYEKVCHFRNRYLHPSLKNGQYAERKAVPDT